MIGDGLRGLRDSVTSPRCSWHTQPMTRRALIAIAAVAAVAAPGAALAAKNDRPVEKCRVISVQESAPEYMGPWDESGTVRITTTSRCRGKLKTSVRIITVTRDVEGNGAPPVGTR